MLFLPLPLLLLLPLVGRSSARSYADWAATHGATFHPSVSFGGVGGGAPSLRAVGAVGRGEVLASVPLKPSGAAPEDNAQLFAMHMGGVMAHPALLSALAAGEAGGEGRGAGGGVAPPPPPLPEKFSPTVVLAVLIMYERRVLGDASAWAPMLEHWPRDASASTLFWPAEDIAAMAGSAVHAKTVERAAALKAVHARLLPLLTEPRPPAAAAPGSEDELEEPLFPDGFPFVNFAVAANQVFGRAFITGGGGAEQNATAVPIIVPVFEALARTASVDATYEERGSSIVLVAGRAFRSGEEIRIFTGHKSNANWMVDYGQFVQGNPFTSVPLGVRIGDDDVIADLKVRALQRLDHTYGEQFVLSAVENGQPPADLLRTMRILFLDLHEFNLARKVLRSDAPVGLANELMVLRAINQACSSLLGKFDNATLEYESEIIERMSAESAEGAPMRRELVGAHVRFEEKRILYLHILWAKAAWEKFLTLDKAALDEVSELSRRVV
jgi:hypothetical protein